ncbi:MAG TPA: TSUP family transporter [Gaiellaceae bacterium]|nr:TSUP family transporter [Gaiellaceae bacterium]
MLVLGGALAAMAAFLAGASGFGLGLVATPLLLLSGFSLPFVVTVNLLISFATRVSVMWRTREWITWRRVAALVGGAVPGLWVGSVAPARSIFAVCGWRQA